MIRFTTLTLRNFLSYGNNTTIVNLERPGTTLIVGEDLDNTSLGQGANGVGKTAILNGLTYAIYDKPVSKISKIDYLVNNINLKEMVVTLEFYGHDGKHYKIHRERKMKAGAAGNNVYFYVDGEDKTLDSAGTNKLIEEAMGIPYELFIRIVVFSGKSVAFFDLPASHPTAPNQKDFIEELFGLTDISEKAKLLKENIKTSETSLTLQKSKTDQLEKEHARHETLIETAKKRVETWKVKNASDIDNLFAKLEAIAAIDFDAEKAAHAEVASMRSLITEVSESLRTVERNRSDLRKEDKKVTDELIHLRDAKCPRCLQDYAGAQAEIKTLQARSVDISGDLVTFDARITQLQKDIADLNDVMREAKAKITVPNLDELLEIKNQSANITAKIQELDAAINPFIEPLDELLAVELEAINYDEVNALTVEVDHQKFLLKLLTKSDSFVRKALLNKNIPYLNKRLMHYLNLLGLPHQVEFTHEMSAKISQFGRPLDFGNLSAGQQARVNISLSFAFKDVLQRLYTKINVCMLDEVLDVGLDAIGVAAAARVIKRKARDDGLSMYIITHKSEVDGVFDHKLTVQMSKGFSYIVEDKVS